LWFAAVVLVGSDKRTGGTYSAAHSGGGECWLYEETAGTQQRSATDED